MPTDHLFLKPNEAKFLSMAVVSQLDFVKEQSKNIHTPWTPETRKLFKEMIESGEMLSAKLTKLGFDMRPLPPFIDGDEKEFLTKES